MASLISVENLDVTFDRQQVLKGINLTVEQGEIVAVMGSSGGGKTTLLRAISGLVKPTSGRVLVNGIDVERDPERARRLMGMVFQSAALFDYMTVEENIAFGLSRWSKEGAAEQKAKIKAVLELMGLGQDGHKLPADLSGGMKKRCGIARALVLNPMVMLYDEPTTGLDPITTYTIDSLVVDLRRRTGLTSLLVSHDVNSVLRVADRVAFLEKGEVTFLGVPADFVTSDRPAIRELVHKAQAVTLA